MAAQRPQFTEPDTMFIQTDQADSLLSDTIPADRDGRDSHNPLDKVKIADDAPEDIFRYKSEQYNRLNNKDRTLILIEAASVEFENYVLEADTIILNTKTKIAYAYSTKKSYVEFTGDGQNLKAKSLMYNFETKKGRIFGAITQQEDLFINAGITKFTGESEETEDGQKRSVGYSKDAIITTCNHPEPHYGLHAYKQKIVQDRVLVTGPANLEIAGVPTPFFLPFAILPLDMDLETGGLIVPRDYDVQPLYGFGLRNIGYFQPISDHWAAAIFADIYTRGSHGLRLNSNYNYRYRSSGQINLEYANRQRERVGILEKEKNISYAIRWNHTQDQKANPYSNFSGSVNITTSRHDQFTQNTADAAFNNQFSSNVNYNYNFPDKPYRITLNASHTQNSQTRQMKFNLPNASFFLNRIKPFERKQKIGNEKWFEKVTFQYTAEYRNEISVQDSLLFTSAFFDNMKMGMRHRAVSDMNFKVLKYLNFTPNVNYNETWVFDTLYREFLPETVVELDTILQNGEMIVTENISYGQVLTSREFGFASFRDMNFGVSMNTNLFGMLRFRRGPLKAVRHQLKPTFSYRYQPVFQFSDERRVRFDNRIDSTMRYSIFEDGIYGRPPMGVAQESFAYSFLNLIEMKVRGKRDTVDRKIKLLENISVGGNYNFRADSLNWSQIQIRGTTRFFNNLTSLGVDVAFDPYLRNERGVRINRTVWEDRRRPVRFDQANLRLTTNFSIRQLRDFIGSLGGRGAAGRESKEGEVTLPEFAAMFDEFRISHNFNFGWANVAGRDTFRIVTNNIATAGRIKLSEKWNLRVGNIGYEFTQNQFTFPDFGIARDLHCWEMGVDWQPFYGTFAFFIRVKPSSFDFLNLPYRKSSSDVLQGF